MDLYFEEEIYFDCAVCSETKQDGDMIEKKCCAQLICEECMKSYCAQKIKEGMFKIECPFTTCDKKLDHGMILNNLEEETHKKLFRKLIAESLSNPCVKSCPGCSRLETISDQRLRKMGNGIKSWFFSTNPKETQISCLDCDLNWCFLCHAPWHEGISCSTCMKGDQAFAKWMNWKSGSEFNAHFCPKCLVPIQRSTGCPNMMCTQCQVHWCYDCGRCVVPDGSIFGPHHLRTALKGCLAPRYLYFNSISITYFYRILLLLLMPFQAIMRKKPLINIMTMPLNMFGRTMFNLIQLSWNSFMIISSIFMRTVKHLFGSTLRIIPLFKEM